MSEVTIDKGIKAMDALGKIQSLLAAAMYLTESDEETELQLELMTIAESIAAKTLECCK
ncbi:hypothetical protein SAMN05216522_11395 [Rosenbergiella nectarea]|uniref:Uncharacterized protein n=1 Tax=Rosenbergiella nectarea TaxID=988801 RepID=A0A1H9M5M6_9GAMM|nr:hypothetical protein [Rosenbergiella nectarea]SER18765.1 hypothetical protein SAMN05216522_11395 [Rosenbergiella nectarea]